MSSPGLLATRNTAVTTRSVCFFVCVWRTMSRRAQHIPGFDRRPLAADVRGAEVQGRHKSGDIYSLIIKGIERSSWSHQTALFLEEFEKSTLVQTFSQMTNEVWRNKCFCLVLLNEQHIRPSHTEKFYWKWFWFQHQVLLWTVEKQTQFCDFFYFYFKWIWMEQLTITQCPLVQKW